MKTLRLMCEPISSDFNDYEIIIEKANSGNSGEVKIKGPYLVAEVKNANGRTYSKQILEKAVENYSKERIDSRRSVGELNHPDSAEVNYENACHLIGKLHEDKNIWIGESRVLLGTPKGDLLAGLLKNGVRVGMSSRGVGNVASNNCVDEYKLIAIDAVSDPSAPGCWVNGILESKKYLIDEHGEIFEVAIDKLEKNLVNIPRKNKNEFLVSVIKDFIKNI